MTDAPIERHPFADFTHRTFDLVVIGAGITGVQVAREGAGRGLDVLLVDKSDVGAGTSSATTRYLHGGIRYLEQREFGVVRESLRERRILSLGAPHLVERRRFLMPGWRWSEPSTALIGVGVAAYTAMGFDRNRGAPSALRMPLPRWVPKRRLRSMVPWLDPVELQGAWAYDDVLNVHPERLLLSYVRDAVALGATVRTHCAVVDFEVLDGHIAGVVVRDADPAQGNRTDTPADIATIRTSAVVNAAGPWVDIVLRSLATADDRSRPLGVAVQRSKGVHLLTRPLGGDATVYCRARNGSHVIVSPWQGHSFIGPTDTPISDDPDEVRADRCDVDSILSTVNATLATDCEALTVDDVAATTVGIRPLVESSAESYAASRRHQLYDHTTAGVAGVWSIGGGKWTTGRATAAATLDALLDSPVLAHVGRRIRHFDSARRPTFASSGWAADADAFFSEAEATASGLGPATCRHLARLYGTEWQDVAALASVDPELAMPVSTRGEDISAQVAYAVTVEGARSIADIVDRRLVIGTLGPLSRVELERVALLAAPHLGWSRDEAHEHALAEHRQRMVRIAAWH